MYGTDAGPNCMKCQSCTVWGYTVHPQSNGQVHAVAECIGCGARSERFEVFALDGAFVSLGAPTIAELKFAHMESLLDTMEYYTVLVPYSDNPTVWHPTDSTGPFAVLTRGCFKTRDDAKRWARENLGGQQYSIRFCDPRA